MVKLEFFSRIVGAYESVFARSLSGGHNSGFFAFGQICRLTRRLAGRFVESESLPDEQLWHHIHTVGYGDLPRLKPTEFLQKHRLSGKLEPACRKRAQQEVLDKLHPNGALDENVWEDPKYRASWAVAP